MVNTVGSTLPDLLTELSGCYDVYTGKDAKSIDFSMLIENILSGGEDGRDKTEEVGKESLLPYMGLLLSNIINAGDPMPDNAVNESVLDIPAGKSLPQITGPYDDYGGKLNPLVPEDMFDTQAEKLLQAVEPAQSKESARSENLIRNEELAQSGKITLKDINAIAPKDIANCKIKQDTDGIAIKDAQQGNLKDLSLNSDNALSKQNKASKTGGAAENGKVALSSTVNMANDEIYGIENLPAKQSSHESLGKSSEKDEYRTDKYEIGEKSITFKFDTALRYENISTFDNRVFIHQADKLARLVKNEVIDSLTYIQKNTSKKIEIKLEPEFLGKLTIKLERTADEINVKILTSNLNVKEILSDQTLKMAESIKNWGVDADIDVVYTGTSGNSSDARGSSDYNASGKGGGTAAANELFEGDAFQPLPEQIDKMLYYYSNTINCLI